MVDEAVRLVETMERSGVEPDLYSYNELLKGFCKANMVDRAHLMMVERMQTKGMCDVVSYNTVITAFCKARRTRKGYELFECSGKREGFERGEGKTNLRA